MRAVNGAGTVRPHVAGVGFPFEAPADGRFVDHLNSSMIAEMSELGGRFRRRFDAEAAA